MNTHTDDWRGIHLIRSAPRRTPRESVTVASGKADQRRADALLSADCPRIRLMAAMWITGRSLVDIRADTGMTENQIRRWRRKLSLPTRKAATSGAS